jgi:HK97 family phage major capsid protein
MPTPIHEIENLRSERAEAVMAMRAILDAARAENRGLTAEERQEHNRHQAEFVDLQSRIEDEEGLAAAEGRLSTAGNVALRNASEAAQAEDDEFDAWSLFATPEYRRAHREYMLRGAQNMSPDNRAVLEQVRTEAAAYNIATPADGGYTVPETWRTSLVEVRTQFGVLRQLATVIQTSGGNPLHFPIVVDAQVATTTAEAAPYTESEDTFGEKILGAYKQGVLVKISDELMQDSLFNMDAFISRRAGRALSLKEGALFAKGTGGGAAVEGITVGASVGFTTASATAITADELLRTIHSVSPPYRPGSQWVMHDSTLLAVALLVDDFNNYVWQPGLQAGDPDRIRGYQVYIDPFYDTIAAAKVIATFGDHSGYFIRDAGPVLSLRLNELYAESGQVGFRFSERIDGALIDTAAVKSLKTHA